ncbi:alpha-amylase family glycosyl hydrolase [Zunongwangia sp. F363]|uniref:Alpha-amylase family glycosyl hydrolase n=1 Tax=Autumnicola tepida TaxID=3075595 RepID=A0ABU3C544_9FLAO|nr:alpha-amylase family glycosyl hydrolase [Zunongwangia sp. F363]MDT0641245.1 alpha-amylase family glycosyl hydrolase [Zunongwangia sp. F363]
MKKHINIFLALFISAFMSACNSDDDGAVTDNPDYDQYGEVFNEVPEPEEAVIYQVNLRAFSEEGTIDAVTARLDHIKELGANVVYLMPIYPNGIENSAGGLGSPYAVRDYKEVSSEYGDLEDLRNLVEEAHNRDMAVVLDWVANHTAWDNEWTTEHPEYYETDENGNMIPPPGTNWSDVVQLDYDNPDLQNAMIDAMSYWVYNANIDGFRCDAADYVPEGFWTKAVSAIDEIKDQEMLMLAEGGEQRHLRSGFDLIFGFNFFETLKEVHNGAPATEIQMANAEEYQNVYDEDKRVVRYITNHDVNLSDGTPMELFGGTEGALATFVVAAYMKSVPMIYNGQEIAYDERLEFFTKTPIDWSQANNEVFEEYQRIIAFRKNSTAIEDGQYSGYSSNDVAAFTIQNDEETVFVLSNIRNQESNYLIPQQLQGEWEDAFEGNQMSLEDQITLQPYTYLILQK